MTDPGLRIASYRPGDEEMICALMEVGSSTTLDQERLLRLWRWRFVDAPVDEIFIDLAWDGDRLVGQYAVQPIRMQIHGVPRLWVISLDTVTHPDDRRRGIFGVLTDHLYARIRDKAQVVFGFPGERASYFGMYRKLGWIPVEPHPKLARIGVVPRRLTVGQPALRAAAALVDRLVAPAQDLLVGLLDQGLRAGRFDAVVTDRVPEDVDGLWARLSGGEGIRVTTDQTYLRWRYDSHPFCAYEYVALRGPDGLVGLAVIRPPQKGEHSRFGHIMDVLVEPGRGSTTAAALIGAALRALQARGGRTVWVFAPVGGRLRRILTGFGFLPMRGRGGEWPWTLGARVLGDGIRPEEVLDAPAWHIGCGVMDML
ncbi:MAG: GNAT family N-acetyltransferase [Pseudomonadota bacterium]